MLPPADATVVWNPIGGAMALRRHSPAGVVLCDLLDDWTEHAAFASLHTTIEECYRALFDRADYVTANSEATVALAQRLGRPDVRLIRNGCDPERFTTDVDRHTHFTVGYGGKIGHRLDVALIRSVAERFPDWRFEFVGPILERSTRRALRGVSHVHFLGDVHYERYPEVFRRWDLAWVPHRTGAGEVGGDVIKLYEYRAAGLPVVTTRIIGWERSLPGVTVADPPDVADTLEDMAGSQTAGGVQRDAYDTPVDQTWRYKAEEILTLLDRPGVGRTLQT
jgi:glycosyltransferase involved in cell wall biosynthesis